MATAFAVARAIVRWNLMAIFSRGAPDRKSLYACAQDFRAADKNMPVTERQYRRIIFPFFKRIGAPFQLDGRLAFIGPFFTNSKQPG
jgi:hypothetical protein